MPKTVASNLLPYFYKRHQVVLTGYELALGPSSTITHRYVANNKNVGTYTALAVKRGTITSEDGTVLNEIEIGLDNVDNEFRQWALGGVLEGHECKINLLFVGGSGNTSVLGTVNLYWGIMDAPKGDENWLSVTLRPFGQLDREYPKRIYQAGCNWRFGAGGCYTGTGTPRLSDYQYQGTISAESNGSTLTISHGKAVNYFVPGYVLIRDGAYAKEVRPVLSNDGSSVTVRVSFGHTISSGTTVLLQKLCAKNPEACKDIFNNYENYSGFFHTPLNPII